MPEQIEVRKIQLVGSNRSFTTTIPRNYATALNIIQGDYVKFKLNGKSIILTKLDEKIKELEV
jgi:antitoxin component of MazEF toxin-antitoxin module